MNIKGNRNIYLVHEKNECVSLKYNNVDIIQL